MFKRVAIPLAVVAVIAAAALGGSTGPKIKTSVSPTTASAPAEPASSHTDTTPPPPPSAQVADTTTEADSAARVDTQRGGEIMSFYKGIGATERWSIKAVEVSDGQITVKTELVPKPSDRPLFVGACTALLGAESWIESVRIDGLDATGHARWNSGDDACQTQGL